MIQIEQAFGILLALGFQKLYSHKVIFMRNLTVNLRERNLVKGILETELELKSGSWSVHALNYKL